MRVALKDLNNNPFRNFDVDPIIEDRVDTLKQSIKDYDFWGGILARRTKHNGTELVFGHHRIQAAMKAGIREADIAVRNDINDEDMVRIYALENATQRGNTGTALAGSVAAAVRFLAKALLVNSPALGKIFPSAHAIEKAREGLTGDGVGKRSVTALLYNIPDMNEGVARAQLANLKSSGHYAEIITVVKEEIEAEEREALKELKRAELERAKAEEEQRKAEAAQAAAEERRKEAAKAAKAAKEEADRKRAETEARRAEEAQQRADAEAKLADKRKAEADKAMKEFDQLRVTRDTAQKAADQASGDKPTFDFDGVAKHLTNASHINVFRQLATSPGNQPYLPVSGQARVARELVAMAKREGSELTASFIRMNFMQQLSDTKRTERKLDAEERAELQRKDWSAKAKMHQEDAARNARGFLAACSALADHAKKRPDGVVLHVTGEFRNAVQNMRKAIVLIENKILN